MGDDRPDSWSSTRNFHICWTRVRTMADWRLDGWVLNCKLALGSSASGWESTSSERLQHLPIFDFGKKIWILIDHWESSGRMQAGTEASQFKGVSRRKSTSSGRMILWSVRSSDGVARPPESWNYGQMSIQTGWHAVWTAGREPIFLDLQTV